MLKTFANMYKDNKFITKLLSAAEERAWNSMKIGLNVQFCVLVSMVPISDRFIESLQLKRHKFYKY